MKHLFLDFYFCVRSLSYKVGLWGINGVHFGVSMAYSSFQTRQPKNLDQVWQFCHEVWARISPKTCEKLVQGYKKRLEAIIKSKGFTINY